MVTAVVRRGLRPPAVLRLVAAIAIVLLAGALGLAGAWRSIHTIWSARYGPYEHGYLVFVMAVWIAVVEWRRAPVAAFEPSYRALVPLALAVGALALMEMLYIESTRLVLIPPIVLGAIWAAFGWQVARRLVWSVLFLYFALPQWWIINGALQDLTVAAVSTILRWTSIPAYIEANYVLLPSGGFEIASGCSGLNYLMAGTALTAFFALTRLGGWGRRCRLVAIGVVAAILFNWLRVYLVILVGYLSEMQHYLIRVEHHTLGWVLFVALFVPIVIYGMRLERRELEAGGTHSTDDMSGRRAGLVVPANVVGASMLAGLVLVSPLLAALWSSAADVRAVVPLPERLGRYVRSSGAEPSWLPVIPGADTELAYYEGGQSPIAVYRGGFVAQSRNDRLIGGESLYVGEEFRVESVNDRSLALGDGELGVVETRGRDTREQQVLMSWFEVGAFRARTRLGAKVLELVARLTGRQDVWYVTVATTCSESCDAAALDIQSFLAEANDSIRVALRPASPTP